MHYDAEKISVSSRRHGHDESMFGYVIYGCTIVNITFIIIMNLVSDQLINLGYDTSIVAWHIVVYELGKGSNLRIHTQVTSHILLHMADQQFRKHN